eukprot:GFUD01013111.1.p1 GENE.GFUD01013111.1~~GFUD01013111.1.p1  ORF type:complete len:219 (+),score=73.21 GFUD01013111.1:258-914(+)
MPRGVNSTQTFHNTVTEFTEELVACPYNMAHQLRPARLVRHLVICRRESLSFTTNPAYKRALAIRICSYNSSHHIHRADMEHHLTLCSGAMQFRQEQEHMVKNSEVREQKPEIVKKKIAVTAAADSDDEDWDKEMEGLNLGTYNPMEKVVQENLLFNAKGMNKSGRQNIRSMQRLGDKEGLSQVVNGHNNEKGSSNGAGYLPVGMSECPVKKKGNKKK